MEQIIQYHHHIITIVIRDVVQVAYRTYIDEYHHHAIKAFGLVPAS